MEECYKKERGDAVEKTKTKSLIPTLKDEEYVRKPENFMAKNSILIARAYIMGRYGMLQCAANFSNGYGGKECGKCKVIDNESHRMNKCPEWAHINLSKSNDSINYDLIHSANQDESIHVVRHIISMWDLGNGRNSMRPIVAN